MIRDVFLCHAAEDKRDIVRPLYDALCAVGITCWLDEAEIRWGDSLVGKVQEGLRDSSFVIVVLSGIFLAKPWPRRELASALSLESSSGVVRVLPLLVGGKPERQSTLKELPLLSDKLHLCWEGDPKQVVEAMRRRLQSGEATSRRGGSAAQLAGVAERLHYCNHCGALVGEPTRCPGYANHNFVQGTGKEFCNHCGAVVGKPTKCPGYANHNFVQGAGKEFCNHCGALVGEPTKCPGYANHNFVQGTGKEFCNHCGAVVGEPTKCPGYANHNFAQGTGKEFCNRCGGAIGKPTKCPGYANHNFVQGGR
jgi:hypothetical protein